MRRIRTLDLVEDSNQFTLAELEGTSAVTPWTTSSKEIKLADEVVGIARVDRIPKGTELDVPNRQGDALIGLGLAALVE